MTNSHFDEVCKRHHQKPGSFCAVSAFEFVSKMFGIISLDSFPLQSDPTNEEKGFNEPDLLANVGLQGTEEKFDVNAALIKLDGRTKPDTFHAVSLYDPSHGYHIYVATKLSDKLVLVDPAQGKLKADGKCDVERELQTQLNNTWKIKAEQIHILWISKKAGDR